MRPALHVGLSVMKPDKPVSAMSSLLAKAIVLPKHTPALASDIVTY